MAGFAPRVKPALARPAQLPPTDPETVFARGPRPRAPARAADQPQ